MRQSNAFAQRSPRSHADRVLVVLLESEGKEWPGDTVQHYVELADSCGEKTWSCWMMICRSYAEIPGISRIVHKQMMTIARSASVPWRGTGRNTSASTTVLFMARLANENGLFQRQVGWLLHATGMGRKESQESVCLSIYEKSHEVRTQYDRVVSTLEYPMLLHYEMSRFQQVFKSFL